MSNINETKRNRESTERSSTSADMIIINGKIATLAEPLAFESSLAIKDGLIIAVGTESGIMHYKGENTKVIDVSGRTIIPGLDDSHIHIIRGGLYYNLELRWDGVFSLKNALDMIKKQAQNTPPPNWIRVVGGWSEFQFEEKRIPTIEEVEKYSKDVPTFILHLYHCATLNKAAMKIAEIDKNTQDPNGAEIQREAKGLDEDEKQANPTGLLIARPAATILYSTLAKAPKLSYDEQVNSTRQFMYELNRFGVTSAIDAGGGYQNYPSDYKVIEDLAEQDLLTVRIAYNLFTQNPKKELADFSKWINMVKPGEGNGYYKMNGAGEMLVFSAADWENTLEPRPDLAESMEKELKEVVTLLVKNRWPFRMHATYGESISRFLNVFEQVNKEIPFDGLRWFFDHAETITEESIDRVKALGGGIAIQNRLAFQGEHFIKRYGKEVSESSPPIRMILDKGVPLGAGTDATRVSSYNPWLSLYWLVSGKSVGGTILRSNRNCVNRTEALRLYTLGSAWFSGDETKKGSLEVGKFGDLVVLSEDYFEIPEEDIKNIESVLTIIGGKIVYANQEFEKYAPLKIPVMPSWSPIELFGGGYANQGLLKNKFSSEISTSSQISEHVDNESRVRKLNSASSSEYILKSQGKNQYQPQLHISHEGLYENRSNKFVFSCPCCDDYFSF